MYKSPPSHAKMHKKILDRVTNSKCMLTPTNLLLLTGACLQIQELMKGGGGYSTYIYLGGLGACCRKFLRFLCHERACGAI